MAAAASELKPADLLHCLPPGAHMLHSPGAWLWAQTGLPPSLGLPRPAGLGAHGPLQSHSLQWL